MTLKNNIEAIIIKWAYQIDEVLSNDSAAGLNVNGNFPGPMTEIHFWTAKCMNLESLYDQTRAQTTRKMASILNLTDRSHTHIDYHSHTLHVFNFPFIQFSVPIILCFVQCSGMWFLP